MLDEIFDASSIFTNVPLAFTIELILVQLCPACTINGKDKPIIHRYQECYRREEFRILLQAVTTDTQFMAKLGNGVDESSRTE